MPLASATARPGQGKDFLADFGPTVDERGNQLVVRCDGRDQDQSRLVAVHDKRLRHVAFATPHGSLPEWQRHLESLGIALHDAPAGGQGTACGSATLAAVAVAGGLLWSLVELLSVHRLDADTQLTSKMLVDLVRLSFGVVAGSGTLVALVVAYRRQRVDEDGTLREATRLHTERFTTAVSQLGDTSVAVRLGGVHALSGLADDAPTKELRQTCIHLLCACLRLPYIPDPGPDPGDSNRRERVPGPWVRPASSV